MALFGRIASAGACLGMLMAHCLYTQASSCDYLGGSSCAGYGANPFICPCVFFVLSFHTSLINQVGSYDM